ncbi:MAG: ATP-binding protein [Pseudomonas marincola]
MNWAKLKEKRYLDLIVCFAVVLVVIYLSGVFDLSEKWIEWSNDHEDWELDEVLIGVGISSFMFFWYSIRRLLDAQRESRQRHLTDLKLQDELQNRKRMETVAQMTAGVAHDFNNILAIIMGNAEILAEQVEGKEKQFSAIISSSQKGAELTQHLLSFSRQQQLFSAPIQLTELLPELVNSFSEVYKNTLKIELQMDTPLLVINADPMQLNNALQHLLNNIVDADTERGWVKITCRNFQTEQVGDEEPQTSMKDFVALSVEDRGCGMTEKVASKVFEPFFTTKEVGEGTGLGLSMVYGYLQQSGGFVELSSEIGNGTTVSMFFPRLKSKPNA